MTQHVHLKGKDFWGPPMWNSLHCMCAVYRPQHAKAMLAYLYSLIELIPCDECREHYQKNLKTLPPEKYLKDNHTLFFWSYALHDMVNQQINNSRREDSGQKPKRKKISPPYDDVKNYYFRALVGDCKVCDMH